MVIFSIRRTCPENMIPTGFKTKVIAMNQVDYGLGEDEDIQPLLTGHVNSNDYSMDDEKDCSEVQKKPCQYVDVNFGFLFESIHKKEKKVYKFAFPAENGIDLFKIKDIDNGGGSNDDIHHFYAESGSEASIMLGNNGSVVGTIQLNNGTSYSITKEKCGDKCYRLVRFDSQYDEVDDTIYLQPEGSGSDYALNSADTYPEPENITVAHTSITLYLTDMVLQKYPFIYDTINFLMLQINDGYRINKIPIQLHIHCIKKFPISELDGDKRLIEGVTWDRQKDGKKNILYTLLNLGTSSQQYDDVRVSADMAILLLGRSEDSGVVGASNTHATGGMTLGYALIEAAMTQFTFDHEVAHIYGAQHDQGNGNNAVFSDGYGYLIPPKGSEKRTIMAYIKDGYKKRMQYYSTDSFKGGLDGKLVLGEKGKANNRNIMIIRRFAIASTGDESRQCKGSLWEEYKKKKVLFEPSHLVIQQAKHEKDDSENSSSSSSSEEEEELKETRKDKSADSDYSSEETAESSSEKERKVQFRNRRRPQNRKIKDASVSSGEDASGVKGFNYVFEQLRKMIKDKTINIRKVYDTLGKQTTLDLIQPLSQEQQLYNFIKSL